MPTPDEFAPTGDVPIAEPLRPATDQARTADVGAADPAPEQVVAFSTRNAGPGKLRAGVVAGAAVALAVGAVATSLAASPAQAPRQVSTTTSGGTGATGAGGLAPAAVFDPLVDGSDEAFDHGRNGGRGMNDITITAVTGNNVSLKTDDGWTRTIAVTDAVDVTKGGQDIAVSDLAVGDEVRIHQTRNDDGTYTVEAIVVVVPSVHGEVSDVSSSGFKVTTRDGSIWTITVDGSTEYQFGSGDGTLADVTNGTNVTILGESTGDNALKALTVVVPADRVVGTVQSKTADTIVIEKRDGSTVTIHVDGDTTYHVAGADDADLGDVAVDMSIGVSGRDRADGSVDADAVMAGNGRGGFRGGDGFFGRGGHGDRDKDGPDVSAPSASPSAS
jgi:hypothetical protein